jgi:hypothetical protein
MTEPQNGNPADTGDGGSRYTGFTSEDPSAPENETGGADADVGGGTSQEGSAADTGEGGSRYTGFTSVDPSDAKGEGARGDG